MTPNEQLNAAMKGYEHSSQFVALTIRDAKTYLRILYESDTPQVEVDRLLLVFLQKRTSCFVGIVQDLHSVLNDRK